MANKFEMTATMKADHTSIFIKSAELEKLMKHWASNQMFAVETPFIDGGTTKAYAVQTQPVVNGGAWGRFTQPIMYAGSFNMSYLSLYGLSEGITIRLNTPMSETMLQKMLAQANACVAELLRDYTRPFAFSLTLKEEDLFA